MEDRPSSRFAKRFLIFLVTFVGYFLYGYMTDFQAWFFPSDEIRWIIFIVGVLIILGVQFFGEWFVLFDDPPPPPGK